MQNYRKTFDAALNEVNNCKASDRLTLEDLENSGFSARKAYNNYIPRYYYIKNAIYFRNEDGTCGYTAACLILNYWNKRYGGYVPDEFLDGNDLKTTGYTLQDKLVDYIGSNSSWARDVKNAINQLCDEYWLPGAAFYRFGSIGVDSELSDGRPSIVFGLFTSNPSPAGGNMSPMGNVEHAVTVYGTNGSYYICHYGWSGYEHVLLDKALIGVCCNYGEYV